MEAEKKWPIFPRRHFQKHVIEWKYRNFAFKFSVKFVPKVSNDNIPSLFQIMDWRRPGDKPLSETMMANLLTHIGVARPQWVNHLTLNVNTLCVITPLVIFAIEYICIDVKENSILRDWFGKSTSICAWFYSKNGNLGQILYLVGSGSTV